MDLRQVASILTGIKDVSIAVVGDYFLDKYLITDPQLDEPSVERLGLPLTRSFPRRVILERLV